VGKRWNSFLKPFLFVWIAFGQGRRPSNLSLKRPIINLVDHFDWSIPHREMVQAFLVRSVSINVKFLKGDGAIVA